MREAASGRCWESESKEETLVFGLKTWEELSFWEEKQEQGPGPGFKRVLRGSRGRTSDSGNEFGWILGHRYNLRGANPFIRLQTQNQGYQRIGLALTRAPFSFGLLKEWEQTGVC